MNTSLHFDMMKTRHSRSCSLEQLKVIYGDVLNVDNHLLCVCSCASVQVHSMVCFDMLAEDWWSSLQESSLIILFMSVSVCRCVCVCLCVWCFCRSIMQVHVVCDDLCVCVCVCCLGGRECEYIFLMHVDIYCLVSLIVCWSWFHLWTLCLFLFLFECWLDVFTFPSILVVCTGSLDGLHRKLVVGGGEKKVFMCMLELACN